MQTYPIAKIDLAALKHNLSRVKQLAPTRRVMSVIKANAYGHGAKQIACALAESDAFAVARLAEAMELRDAGITCPIVILEGVNSELDIQKAADNSLSLVFHHQSQIDLLTSVVLSKPLNFCWLMVETGMHRLGLSVEKIAASVQALRNSSNVSYEIGLMSHFANADVMNDSRNVKQLEIVKKLSTDHNIPTSMANSAAILSYPESHGDWLRPGLMLYGISPFEDRSSQELGLKPVMQLQSIVTATQTIKKGEQVGYGGIWSAKQESTIAIISIGYGDGYSRQLSNTGQVSIHGELFSVIGRVSMDMIAIDISETSDVHVGDNATLWGSDSLLVETVADWANTIPYELVCQVSGRVIREYTDGES